MDAFGNLSIADLEYATSVESPVDVSVLLTILTSTLPTLTLDTIPFRYPVKVPTVPSLFGYEVVNPIVIAYPTWIPKVPIETL